MRMEISQFLDTLNIIQQLLSFSLYGVLDIQWDQGDGLLESLRTSRSQKCSQSLVMWLLLFPLEASNTDHKS